MNLIDSLIYVLAQISEKYMYMWCLRSNTHKRELLFHQAIHHYIAQFDLISLLTTLTIEFYSKDICVHHFLHPRYFIPCREIPLRANPPHRYLYGGKTTVSNTPGRPCRPIQSTLYAYIIVAGRGWTSLCDTVIIVPRYSHGKFSTWVHVEGTVPFWTCRFLA